MKHNTKRHAMLPAWDSKKASFVWSNVAKYSSQHILIVPFDDLPIIPSSNNLFCVLPARSTKDAISERSNSIWGHKSPYCTRCEGPAGQKLGVFPYMNMPVNRRVFWWILTIKGRELLSGQVILISLAKTPRTNSRKRSY